MTAPVALAVPGSGFTTVLSPQADDYTAAVGNQTVLASGGDDIVRVTSDGNAIYGEAGNDNLGLYLSTSSNNLLDGGAGNDFLYPSDLGNNTLVGGIGTDEVGFTAPRSGVTLILAGGSGTATWSTGSATVSEVENIYGSTYSDFFVGDAGNNLIVADWGNDTVYGGDGNDTIDGNYKPGMGTVEFDQLFGGNGDDVLYGTAGSTLDGGAGNDKIVGYYGYIEASYLDATAGVKVSLAVTTAQNTVGAGTDTLTNVIDLTGSNFNDTLTGNALSNWIDGLGGNDLIDGGAGDDWLKGGTGNDTLKGGDGRDLIEGGDGNDVLDGSGGTTASQGFGDMFRPGLGTNTVIGHLGLWKAGDGAAISYSDLSGIGGVVIDSSNPFAGTTTAAGGVVNDTFKYIEFFEGSQDGDVIYGNSYGYWEGYAGLGGADTIYGSSGWSLLDYSYEDFYGGASSGIVADLSNATIVDTFGSVDRVYGVEQIVGTDWNDVMTAAWQGLYISQVEFDGGLGNDTLTGGPAQSWLDGGDGDDSLTGGTGRDTIDGGNGNDRVNAGDGNDFIYGSFGSDTVDGGLGYDILSAFRSAYGVTVTMTGAGAGSGVAASTFTTFQNIEFFEGSNFLDVFNGAGGDDAVWGADGDDTLIGQGGDDYFEGGRGNDVIDGGIGIDTVSYAFDAPLIGIIAAFTAPDAATVKDGLGFTDTLYGIEFVQGSDKNDKITGTIGTQYLSGMGGNDTLDGGADTDWAVYNRLPSSGAVAVVNVNLVTGAAKDASGGTDRLIGIENVEGSDNSDIILGNNGVAHTFLGNDGLDQLTGGNLGDLLDGGLSHDVLKGLDGNDTLIGGDGFDTLDGGLGTDSLDGGLGDDTYIIDGTDILVEAVGGGRDTIVTSLNWTLTGEFENVTLTGTAALTATGNAYDNLLTGNTGANLLNGLDGNDTLNGGTGADTMVGGIGNDTYVIDNAGDVTVEQPGQGTDTIQTAFSWVLGADYENLTLTGTAALSATGNSGANVIVGNSGDNLVTASGGDDTITGGFGVDTVTYAGVASGINVDLYFGTATKLGIGSDTLIGISNIVGTSGNDTILGDSPSNVLSGGGGDDLMGGRGGIDKLDGGTGTDTLTFNLIGAGVPGTGIVFSLASTAAQTNMFWGTLTALNFENLTGASGNDKLTGSSGANVIDGWYGNDTIDGGLGADTLIGGGGDDTFLVDNAGDVVTETTNGGLDMVVTALSWTLASEVENLTLTGTAALTGTGNASGNQLVGNSGANALFGLDGNDTLNGGAGADTLTGGIGNDVFVVDNLGDVVVEAAGGGTDRVESTISCTLAADIENLTLLGTAAINGTGNSAANVIGGNGANNVIEGGDGNDSLYGGFGTDTASYATAAGGVVASLSLGQAVQGAFTDFLAGFENLTGSNFDDHLTGSATANVLSAGAGNDTVAGGFGTGADVLDGGVGTDTWSFAGVSAGVTASLATTGSQTIATGNTITAKNFENLEGGNGNDKLTGSTLANLIDGGAGNDTLDGGVGADTLLGGSGNDTFRVDNAGDVVTEATSGAAGGVDEVVSLLSTYTLGANVEWGSFGSSANLAMTGNALDNILYSGAGGNLLDGGGGNDTVSYARAGSAVKVDLSITTAQATGGSGSDTLTAITNLEGSNFNDVLRGSAGSNALSGGNGNDTLYGNGGNDILTGLAGSDVFVFNTLLGAGNIDRITDYNTVADTIWLDDAIFSALAVGKLAAGALNFGAAATEVDDRIIFDAATGSLYYDPDGSGGTVQQAFANLTGITGTLSVSDFLIV